MMVDQRRVAHAQDLGHDADHDYEPGSPHLRHQRLRQGIEDRLASIVDEIKADRGHCRVLEIGGGHGTFTGHLLACGADVTVTETSAASAEYLRTTFVGVPNLEIRYDATGEEVLSSEEQWDLAVLISVVHHIPDYLAFLDRLSDRITVGGGIFTVQDPLYYPRRSRRAHWLGRGTYFAWRLGQGSYGRGLATRMRRLRGVYDEEQPSDLVEYHVVRQGCDEVAIQQLLQPSFDVEVFTYWSTQSPLFQRAIESWGVHTDFGVEARRKRA